MRPCGQVGTKVRWRDRLGLLLAVLFLVYGATVRLIALSERPFTADESLFAMIAYGLATGDRDLYDPGHHGPLPYYLTAAVFRLFGISDTTARLPSALIGIALLGLAFPLARERNSRVGLAFLALTALSPTYAVLSREVRGELLALLLVSGCLLAALRKGPGVIVTLVLLAAAAVATKETSLVAFGIAGVSALIAAPGTISRRLRTLEQRELAAAGITAMVGAFLFVLLYTGFGAHPEDWNGLGRAAFYWLGRHFQSHYPGGFLYFPGLLAVYEPLICILALAAFRFVKRDPWCRFLALLWVGNLTFYGWAQEKVPHLVLYPLLPATLLAAESLGSLQRRALLGVVGIALLVTALVQVRAVRRSGVLDLEHPWRFEALTYRTMSPHFPEFVERVRVQSEGRVVAADPLFQLLLAWPLRDRTISTGDDAPPGALRVAQSLRGELVSCVWVPVWEEANLQQILRYALMRKAFGPFSCQIGAIGP